MGLKRVNSLPTGSHAPAWEPKQGLNVSDRIYIYMAICLSTLPLTVLVLGIAITEFELGEELSSIVPEIMKLVGGFASIGALFIGYNALSTWRKTENFKSVRDDRYTIYSKVGFIVEYHLKLDRFVKGEAVEHIDRYSVGECPELSEEIYQYFCQLVELIERPALRDKNTAYSKVIDVRLELQEHVPPLEAPLSKELQEKINQFLIVELSLSSTVTVDMTTFYIYLKSPGESRLDRSNAAKCVESYKSHLRDLKRVHEEIRLLVVDEIRSYR